MSGYGDRDNSEYVEGNQGDVNYIDSNPTRGPNAGNGGMMDKIKGAMGMGSSNKDRSDYDSSNTDSYGSGNTRDKYSSGDNYDSSNTNTNTDTYGSGNTGTGRGTSDTYGSSGRDTTDSYGSNTGTGIGSGLGTDTYGSTGNTSSSFGVGNNTTAFTDQPIGSTKGFDAFANKEYDGQRTVDDFTSTTGTGASNLTSRTAADSYGQGNTTDSYGQGNTDTYGSNTGTGLGSGNTTDTYGSTGGNTSNTYGSTGGNTTDTYGSSGDNYGEGQHKKEGLMDKVAGKMGMRTNADAYDQDKHVRDVNPENY